MATHVEESPPLSPGITGGGPYRTGPTIMSGRMATQTRGSVAVQYTIVDGVPMVEGDIVLDLLPGVEELTDSDTSETDGVIIPGTQFRWPNGLVPYEIDSALPDQARITNAIAHWERNTRIRFAARTAANAAQFPNFIRFVPADGCSSSVGMRGSQQDIQLAPGCDFGSAVHEIGHSVGLWHEQSREDRGNFVRINFENIEAGREHNFNQHISDGDDVGPYDYHSIMHYPRLAFSRNGSTTIDPVVDVEIGQRGLLSPGDCHAVRAMYSGLEPAAVFRGVQVSGTVGAGATSTWFTHSWPPHWWVEWTVVPTAPAVDGSAQVEWSVRIDRQTGGLLKYFISVHNLTAGPVGVDLRFDVLGWSPDFR